MVHTVRSPSGCPSWFNYIYNHRIIFEIQRLRSSPFKPPSTRAGNTLSGQKNATSISTSTKKHQQQWLTNSLSVSLSTKCYLTNETQTIKTMIVKRTRGEVSDQSVVSNRNFFIRFSNVSVSNWYRGWCEE